jgi:catechol 2,3-dioxygenase-like lactoylglutathione lyase family enzyme
MRPFAIRHIDHLVLRVVDLSIAISFYEKVLGCELVKRRDDLGLVHLRAGASMVDLVSVDGALGRRGGGPAGATSRNLDHLCLRVEPFVETELVQFLASHGVSPVGPAEENFGAEGDGLSLYISDPDGNFIELKGPIEAH